MSCFVFCGVFFVCVFAVFMILSFLGLFLGLFLSLPALFFYFLAYSIFIVVSFASFFLYFWPFCFIGRLNMFCLNLCRWQGCSLSFLAGPAQELLRAASKKDGHKYVSEFDTI